MEKFDMHIHTYEQHPDPEKFVAELEKSGFYGGCIFSSPSDVPEISHGISFEARLDELDRWTKGYEGRLFPVIWMHPTEENAIEKVKIAVDRGVAGFKFILHDIYAGDERCLALFREIAKYDKPIFFHSGILWSSIPDEVSKYNRPVNWEAMLKVPGLRFSLGHCSWPWVDECIALYGRLNDAKKLFKDGEKPCEMFFDLTPGTPDNYREELFTKLIEVDMDNVNNIMFGCDQWAERYKSSRLDHIYEMDRKILDKLGVSVEVRKRIYHDNLMRFLGINKEVPERIPFVNKKGVADICRKWYKKLEFPMEYNNDFELLLKEYDISDAITADKYDYNEKDGKRNLLSMLFMCEELEEKYREKGIDEKILIDTAKDIVLWTNSWTNVKGELCLYELPWLSFHMQMKLFRIGSLEFVASNTEYSCPELGLSKGDPIVEIHIPEGADMRPEKVEESINAAKEFFAKYYPEHKYEHFTFHSWIMDKELAKLLKPESNILKFQNSFTRIESEITEDYAALRYVFGWDTTRMNLRSRYASSSFAENMKKHVLSGGKLHLGVGVRKK